MNSQQIRLEVLRLVLNSNQAVDSLISDPDVYAVYASHWVETGIWPSQESSSASELSAALKA